ncbi:MAG: TerB family tellurite resistance protein [Deltaproteobacteria bacterium]|nr:TerB family tellurite resistance protein [Deltaproteobacteria bacterium]
MRLENISKLGRNELIYLLKIIAPEEVFSYRTATLESLQEMAFSSLGYLLEGTVVETQELELKFFSRLSDILEVSPVYEQNEIWGNELFNKLGEKVLGELRPVLEVAQFMAWADGQFVTNEIAVFDVIFSQLKLLKRYKNQIVEMCLNQLPIATMKADLTPFRNQGAKAEMLLAFAWAIAMVDSETHETEIKAYDDLSEILGISDERRNDIRNRVTQNWKRHSTIISDKSKLVIESSGIDDYIKHMIGLDVYSLFSKSNVNKNAVINFEDKFNSLTLFSKISMLCRPELSLIDRVVLVIALILSEV